MSKIETHFERYKPLLIKLLEDEEVINSLRGTLCKLLSCGADAKQDAEDEEGRAAPNAAKAAKLQKDLDAATKRANALQAQLEEQKHELDAERDNKATAERELASSQHDLTQCKKQREHSQQESTQWQKKYQELEKQSRLPDALQTVLEHIKQDQELSNRFELHPSADELIFLQQTVAVLAQEVNVKRLWELYKQRCENQKGAIDPQDMQVFETVLDWHNANQPNKPYPLERPNVGTPYNYETHMKPATGMKGETIQAVWLPGVAALKLKPLVATE